MDMGSPKAQVEQPGLVDYDEEDNSGFVGVDTTTGPASGSAPTDQDLPTSAHTQEPPETADANAEQTPDAGRPRQMRRLPAAHVPTPAPQPGDGGPAIVGRYVHEPNRGIPRASRSLGHTAEATTIFNVRVDFQADISQGDIRDNLFSTRTLGDEQHPHIVPRPSAMAIPVYTPIGQLVNVDYKHMGPYTEGKFNDLSDEGKQVAKLMASHYCKEDCNLQRMEYMYDQEVMKAVGEEDRLKGVLQQFEAEAQACQQQKNADVDAARAAIIKARHSSLRSEAAHVRVDHARVQMRQTTDQLVVKRKEHFASELEAQAKKSKDFSRLQAIYGEEADAAAKVVESGVMAISPTIDPPARPFNRD